METAEILICENESLVAADLQKRIEGFGHVVTAVSNTGEEAISLASRLRPDIALMDISLDGKMNGIEAAHILDSKYQIPSVFLTAFADSKTLESATSAHPLGYLVKPIADAELRAAIEIAMSLKFRLALLAISKTLHTTAEPISTVRAKSNLSYDNGSIQYIPAHPLLNAMNLSCGYAGFHVSKLLGPLNASLSWLSQCGTLQEFELRQVTEAQSHLDKVYRLVKKLLWCSKLGVSHFTFESIPEIIQQVIAKMNAQFAESLTFKFSNSDQDLIAFVDRASLVEALSNLLINAAEAQSSKGEIVVDCYESSRPTCSMENQASTQSATNIQSNSYITVKIQDQGSGMQLENIPRIFEPFYTTKDSIDALGLGLSVAYGVIAAHNGWIEAACTRDKGSAFTIHLPQAEKHSTAQSLASPH